MTQLFSQTPEAVSQAPMTWTFDDGSRGVVRPASGRVLSLYPPESEENFFWSNPALVSDTPSADLYDQPGWVNLGGDRTWLAPEIELFIEDLDRPWETYGVQSALDPGSWKLASDAGSEPTLINDTRLRLYRSAREVGVRLSKSYRTAENPLRGTALANAGLQYAGYTQITTLEQEAVPGFEVRLGIWNLLQLPAPGVMLIPTLSPVQTRLVFGNLREGECQVEARIVRWEMGETGVNTKIAFKPQALTGRAGYFRETATEGTADLIVREFAVGAEEDYVDTLWQPPNEAGWVFQACSVREGDARFNELEYHGAVAKGTAGLQRDESRLWAFRGPKQLIAQASAILLGAAANGVTRSTFPNP